MAGVLFAMEICKSFSVRAILALLAIDIRFGADGAQLQNMVNIGYLSLQGLS
jgi:hypothetical protein